MDMDKGSVKDPICGMELDPPHVKATRDLAGERFFFCSNRCAEVFDRERKDAAGSQVGVPGECP